MSHSCENILRLTAHSVRAEKQLKEFKAKSKTDKNDFDLAGTYPCPIEAAFEWSSMIDAGVKILKFRLGGEPSSLEEYLGYDWVKKKGIKTLKELEKCLIDEKRADLNLGKIALENLNKYGETNKYSWCETYWGTSWVTRSKIQYDRKCFYCVTFFTRNSPPYEWLIKVAKDFPDLHFNLEWEIPEYSVKRSGIVDAVKGSIVEYKKEVDWSGKD